MRTLIIVFCFFLLAVEISFPVGAVTTPQIDEIEIMMAKIKSNLQMASQVTQEVSFGGPIYEAYLNYVEEGGKEDFDYFRMYIWQQK